MPKKKSSGEKDPFRELTKEFKDAVDGMAADEVKSRVAAVALEQADLEAAEKDDGDLAEKKEAQSKASAAVKFASKIYTEGKKTTKLKIRYLNKRLKDLGKK